MYIWSNTIICTCLANFASNFVHFIHRQFCKLQKCNSQKSGLLSIFVHFIHPCMNLLPNKRLILWKLTFIPYLQVTPIIQGKIKWILQLYTHLLHHRSDFWYSSYNISKNWYVRTKLQIPWGNCVRFSLDNTTANMGVCNSIKNRFALKNVNCCFMGCSCHVIHDTAHKASIGFTRIHKVKYRSLLHWHLLWLW